MFRTSLLLGALLLASNAQASTYNLSVSSVLPADDGSLDGFVSNCFNCNLLPSSPYGMWIFDQAGVFNESIQNISLAPTNAANGGTYLSVYGTASLYLFPSVSAKAYGVSFVLGSDDANNKFSFGDISINGETLAPFTPDPSLLSGLDRDVFVTITGLTNLDVITLNNSHNFALETDNWKVLTVATGAPEPATWAMMLLGFFGLSFVGVRRRARLATI